MVSSVIYDKTIFICVNFDSKQMVINWIEYKHDNQVISNLEEDELWRLKVEFNIVSFRQNLRFCNLNETFLINL